MGVVLRRYIDFLILLIPTPLVSVFFCSSIPIFCSFKKMFFVLYNYTGRRREILCIYIAGVNVLNNYTQNLYILL